MTYKLLTNGKLLFTLERPGSHHHQAIKLSTNSATIMHLLI